MERSSPSSKQPEVKILFCDKCRTKTADGKCLCENGPYTYHWPIPKADEDYWMMDGSIKPLLINSQMIRSLQR